MEEIETHIQTHTDYTYQNSMRETWYCESLFRVEGLGRV